MTGCRGMKIYSVVMINYKAICFMFLVLILLSYYIFGKQPHLFVFGITPLCWE